MQYKYVRRLTFVRHDFREGVADARVRDLSLSGFHLSGHIRTTSMHTCDRHRIHAIMTAVLTWSRVLMTSAGVTKEAAGIPIFLNIKKTKSISKLCITI